MTVKELQLAGRLLEAAAEQFANHNCNDIQPEIWGDMTTEERKELIKEYYLDNDEVEESREDHIELEDYCLMRFLADKLKRY